MTAFTHELLSPYVGTTREVVTHYMNQFRRQWCLRHARECIVIYRDSSINVCWKAVHVIDLTVPPANRGRCPCRSCAASTGKGDGTVDRTSGPLQHRSSDLYFDMI
jgi:hypothetical protein